MARKIYRIDEFVGIDQSSGENGMSPAYSPDACNMDTEDGELRVAGGFSRYIQEPVPGQEPIGRMFLFHTAGGNQVIVAAGSDVYAWKQGAWGVIYSFAGGLTQGRVSFLEARIGAEDQLIIGNGRQQLVKYNGTSAVPFGSADSHSDAPLSHLALYRNRLFAAGDIANPGRLYWSQLPGGTRSIENWGDDPASPNVSGGHTEIGTGAGDPITGMAALSNQLIIFKRRSIYRLLGDKPSNFTVEKLEEDTEPAAGTSIVSAGDMLYFMTKGGMCRFNGVTVGLMPDARRIKKTLAGASVEDTRGAALRGRLYFTIEENGESALVEYDRTRGAYMLRRGFHIADIAAWEGELYMVNRKRYVYRFDQSRTYDGYPIEAWWRTPETDLFDKSGVKAMRSLCFRGHSENAETALGAEVYAGTGRQDCRVLLPLEESDVVEMPLKNQGRTFSLKLKNEAGGRFALRGGVELAFETWRRVE